MSERSLERWMHIARKDYEALQAENAALKSDVRNLVKRIADERRKTLEQIRNERIAESDDKVRKFLSKTLENNYLKEVARSAALEAENYALKRAALALSKSKFNERDGHFNVSAELMNKLDELLR